MPGDAEELLPALQLERAAFIPFYQALRRAQTGFYNREALLDYFTRETRTPRHTCALAADIALELGFLSGGEGSSLRFVPPEGRQELSQSATFTILASVAQMHEYAIQKTRCNEADAQTHQHHHEEEQP